MRRDFTIIEHANCFQIKRRDGAVVAEVDSIEVARAIAEDQQRRLDLRTGIRHRQGASAPGRRKVRP
jgi:hypothetical protein